ncbi:SgcJ/EcaC family oxidoreductase [Laceyella putida]|uniref:SgcJ/EcaC family oxidoreductase n=1 Tax=Laceyella putida TaxID=110101 RepID=A0ABW2RP25_9BACL
MSSQTFRPSHSPSNSDETEVRSLYQQLLEGWNKRSADAMAEPFAEDGELIGFDGSQVTGRAEIASHLQPIFANHPTAAFVSKIRSVRLFGPEVAVLRAVAGMVPPGQSDIDPKLNTHHTLITVKREGKWRIALFQNTPAQFHGRPELVQKLTEELRQSSLIRPV